MRSRLADRRDDRANPSIPIPTTSPTSSCSAISRSSRTTATGNKLGGAVFEIRDGSGALDGHADDGGGHGRGQEQGRSRSVTYTLTETAAPAGYGYRLAYRREDDTADKTYTYNVSDTAAVRRTSKSSRTTATGNMLGGAVFEIRDGTGPLMDTLTTAAGTGEAKSKAAPVRRLHADGDSAPAGYAVSRLADLRDGEPVRAYLHLQRLRPAAVRVYRSRQGRRQREPAGRRGLRDQGRQRGPDGHADDGGGHGRSQERGRSRSAIIR